MNNRFIQVALDLVRALVPSQNWVTDLAISGIFDVIFKFTSIETIVTTQTRLVFSLQQSDCLEMRARWSSRATMELCNFRYILRRGIRVCFLLMDVMVVFKPRCRWQTAPGSALRAYVANVDALRLPYPEQKQPPTEQLFRYQVGFRPEPSACSALVNNAKFWHHVRQHL